MIKRLRKDKRYQNHVGNSVLIREKSHPNNDTSILPLTTKEQKDHNATVEKRHTRFIGMGNKHFYRHKLQGIYNLPRNL